MVRGTPTHCQDVFCSRANRNRGIRLRWRLSPTRRREVGRRAIYEGRLVGAAYAPGRLDMRSTFVRAAIALIAFAPLWAAPATITLQPVTVPDGTSPYLSTISASGALGGVYWNTAQNAALGYVLNGKVVTILPRA